MLHGLVVVRGQVVFLTVLFSLLDDGLALSNSDHLAVLGALHEGFTFKNGLQFCEIDVFDGGSTELLLQKLAHLLRLSDVVLKGPDLTSFLGNQVLVHLECGVWDRGRELTILLACFGGSSTGSELLSFPFFGLLPVDLVSRVCGSHNYDEERESDDSLGQGDGAIHEYVKHPGISDKTED